MPCATGKATSRRPTASTSQVSFASQNGPIEAIIVSRSSSVGDGEQDADAEVEPVEHDVDQDRQAHQPGEDQRAGDVPVDSRSSDLLRRQGFTGCDHGGAVFDGGIGLARRLPCRPSAPDG